MRELLETIQWCSAFVKPDAPATCLRSPLLLEGVFLPEVPANARRALLLELHRIRRAVLEANPSLGRVDFAAGRLLAYEPDNSLSDGAAEAVSDGFLDVENAPPWDTWVVWIDRETVSSRPSWQAPWTNFLVAWVPESFLDGVDAGISVNPEECIQWLSDVAPELDAKLREGL